MTRHAIGPENATLQVRTFRDGRAAKIGHDLIIDVKRWDGAVEVGEDSVPVSLELNADPSSLEVNRGEHGLKPLSSKDIDDIKRTIETEILRGAPITFRSTELRLNGGVLSARGNLELCGTSREVAFELPLGDGGKPAGGTATVKQTDWGIKPYKAFMGQLKVRDEVEIVLTPSS